ncbi:MAG: hypothetical protein K6G09_12755, partial [Treponema sp.]|nr:hypothetical protein [Treponema sp.]
MSTNYTDMEADFWKEHFVHLQHKNMVRTNATALKLEDCHKEFESFSQQHPQAKISTQYFDSYCIFEVTLTAAIKLRLFIQSAIKGSLMQKCGSEYVKLCDAKFPYNPLPEIDEFLRNLDDYLVELERLGQKKSRSERRQKIALEFIMAYAEKHITPKKIYYIEAETDGSFVLKIPSDDYTVKMTDKDFMEKIKNS